LAHKRNPSPPPSPPPPSPPPGVFFHLNDTNATQEDVIYANEYHEALEYEGPVLWPGDLAIWIRHDDVIRYQEIKYNECVAAPIAGVPCKQNNNPCELVLYQSLNRDTTWGGAGLTNMRPDGQKLDDEWDADGAANDKMAYPKCAQTHIQPKHQTKSAFSMFHVLIHCCLCFAQSKPAVQWHHHSRSAAIRTGKL
jgi:hypothetical protein